MRNIRPIVLSGETLQVIYEQDHNDDCLDAEKTKAKDLTFKLVMLEE